MQVEVLVDLVAKVDFDNLDNFSHHCRGGMFSEFGVIHKGA